MIKVFVADDHAMMREGVKRIIDDANNMKTVAEAEDGRGLLSAIGQTECDLLLMDMTMPGMTGMELIQQIRKIRPKLPILVMSMHDTSKIAAIALKAGANGYITKNADPNCLPAIIYKVASGGRFVDANIANSIIFDGDSDPLPHESLSERESQILCMIVSGKSTKGIASDLFLSPKTVSTHKKHIMQKLEVSSTADLVRYSIQHYLHMPDTKN
jgi:DNA-binding NarL/FixJ family response regulator